MNGPYKPPHGCHDQCNELRLSRVTQMGQLYVISQESSGDVVVRALISHQCGPGSIPGSLLCPKRFFPGYSGFPLSSKNLHFIRFDLC